MPGLFYNSLWIARTMSVIRDDAAAVAWPAERSSTQILRALVVGIGVLWSVAFLVLALSYELQLYADGAMFSYAVAAQDVWPFHWHNISGRLTVFLLTLWPAELYVDVTGDPWNGIVIYGFLFYSAPLASLTATFFADSSRPRIIFTYACASTALLCPLVFGFPTEMWIAHALFWPTLAIAQHGRRNFTNVISLTILLTALALTHEGALVLAAAVVVTLALRGLHDALFSRAVFALLMAVVIWSLVKIWLPPSGYFEGVLIRAALHFFDFKIFKSNIVILLIAAGIGYAVALLFLSLLVRTHAHLYAAMIVAVALAIYWLAIDHSIHADNRYYMRTLIVITTPILGLMAASATLHAAGLSVTVPFLSRLQNPLATEKWMQALTGAFLLVTLIHVVELEKFIFAWDDYKGAVKSLAIGPASDPALGDPRFVSSARIDKTTNRLSWVSTTPYLSVILANFSPAKLVVDPRANYFWLSCQTATANDLNQRAIPTIGRDLIKTYSCLHR